LQLYHAIGAVHPCLSREQELVLEKWKDIKKRENELEEIGKEHVLYFENSKLSKFKTFFILILFSKYFLLY